MEHLRNLVDRATHAPTRDERIAAYGRLVDKFRDMACGYAYSMLGDFHLAEDAAQDAFIVAFSKLEQLRQPEAFPGWFRRIVWSACGRIQRREGPAAVDIEAAADVPTAETNPLDVAENNEMKNEVLQAIRQLPEEQREATMLFYINGYSQRDISDFLEVPVSTVKNRLHASRTRLKERMLTMVKDTLHTNAPDERFNLVVIEELLARPKPLEIEGHPVQEVALAIQKALPDFENVTGGEIVEKAEFHKMPEHSANLDRAYHIDGIRALRTETTITIMEAMRGRTPPVKFLVAGRVFRPDTEDGYHLKVFHQLDVLWIDKGLSVEDMKQSIQVAVGAVLENSELRWESLSFESYDPYLEFEAKWNDQWISVGGCGMLQPHILRESGYLDESLASISYGFGLDRLAAIKFGIDDIRKLWQPPYVPG